MKTTINWLESNINHMDESISKLFLTDLLFYQCRNTLLIKFQRKRIPTSENYIDYNRSNTLGLFGQVGKTTAIRRIMCVTSISRQSCVSNWGHSWNPWDDHNTIVFRGVRGALNWAPFRPRDVSLSDRRYNFFSRLVLWLWNFFLVASKFTKLIWNF